MNTTPPLLEKEMAKVRETVRSKRASLRAVARQAGIPFATLSRIYYGTTTDPRVSVLQRLHDWAEQAA